MKRSLVVNRFSDLERRLPAQGRDPLVESFEHSRREQLPRVAPPALLLDHGLDLMASLLETDASEREARDGGGRERDPSPTECLTFWMGRTWVLRDPFFSHLI